MGKRLNLADYGQGTDKFTPPALEDLSNTTGEQLAYRTVPLTSVTTNPLNERPPTDDDLAELAATIREYGTIQPPLVCSAAAFLDEHPDQRAHVTGADWVTLIGNRRLIAARHVGLTELAVIVDDDHVGSMYSAMLVENLQRKDMPPWHEAEAIDKALRAEGLTQSQLAERIGKSPGFISQRLALLKLIPELRQALERGTLKLEDARSFGDLPKAEQEAIAAAGSPYGRRPGPVARRGWAATPSHAATAIGKRFTDPAELAELVDLLTARLESLRAET